MAEPLGVVASGIAIGQAVSSLGQVIFRIKDLCREIGSIPERIDRLLAELEILNIAIESADALFAPPNGDINSRRAAASCQQASLELMALAAEIQRRLSAQSRLRKKIAGLHAVLKKEEMEALEKRLQNAVRVLTVTQNLQMM